MRGEPRIRLCNLHVEIFMITNELLVFGKVSVETRVSGPGEGDNPMHPFAEELT